MKFKRNTTKKTYKKAKIKQLPSNSRFIPENLNSDGFAFLVGIAFIIASIFVVSLDLYSNYKKNKILTTEKIKVLDELVFWKNETEKRPNYRDAYFNLALLNYQLKNLDEVSETLEKALSIDPNFEKGRELEEILNSK